ncbi:MAG: copper transporter [Actinomycetota bacterium]|nr:copper transporter [Actinomycetota bacterium]
MINFRFHLVSLVAVFLALALGVLMGSTVIDRTIVDGLEASIKRVGDRADETRAENLALKARLDALEGYAEQALPLLIGDRLKGVPVAMVAVRGVDGGAVGQMADILRGGGALVPGVVWLEPSLALPDVSAEVRLGEVLGDPFKKGADLRRTAIDALGRRLAAGPEAAGNQPGAADVLAAMGTAGFVAFDSMGSDFDPAQFPLPGSRVLVIDGSQGKLKPDVVALPLIRALQVGGALVALGEVFSETDSRSGRGAIVSGVRDDQALATRVATVDDLEEPRGRAALALALDELGRGQAGHYGEGPGASRQLPEPPPPAPGA